MVPGELVEDEERSECREFVERRAEGIDVVEDAACHDCMERAGIVEFLHCDLPVEGTFGRVWVDREHVVAGRRKRRCEATLMSAADLEHPTRRLG
jgi:hypothetical protein